jgi:hypothetical protein
VRASQDPFLKPCYLFSLVAGDLALREDSHTTHTGRTISLKTYVPAAYIDQVRETNDRRQSAATCGAVQNVQDSQWQEMRAGKAQATNHLLLLVCRCMPPAVLMHMHVSCGYMLMPC